MGELMLGRSIIFLKDPSADLDEGMSLEDVF